MKKKREKTETSIMSAMGNMLDGMGLASRRRVLTWLAQRYLQDVQDQAAYEISPEALAELQAKVPPKSELPDMWRHERSPSSHPGKAVDYVLDAPPSSKPTMADFVATLPPAK